MFILRFSTKMGKKKLMKIQNRLYIKLSFTDFIQKGYINSTQNELR